MSQDYYKTLGVDKDATPADLKKAYREAAKLCHPDKHPDDPKAEAKFKVISEAYATLSDPDKRWAYDNNVGTSHAQGAAASEF